MGLTAASQPPCLSASSKHINIVVLFMLHINFVRFSCFSSVLLEGGFSSLELSLLVVGGTESRRGLQCSQARSSSSCLPSPSSHGPELLCYLETTRGCSFTSRCVPVAHPWQTPAPLAHCYCAGFLQLLYGSVTDWVALNH